MLITPQSTHDMIQGIPAADDGEAALEPRRVSRRAPGRQMETKGAVPPSVDNMIIFLALTPSVILLCLYHWIARALLPYQKLN